MNGQTKLVLDAVLKDIPNIEPTDLTTTQKKILELLKKKTYPILSKKISAELKINYNSIRARISELSAMGFIYQPLKNLTIERITEFGSPGDMVRGHKRGWALVSKRFQN